MARARLMGMGGQPSRVISDEEKKRLREKRESAVGDLARDVAALQSVLVRALRAELGDDDPDAFAGAVERLVEAAGVVQAAAVEEHVRHRSRELEAQANTDPLTGLYNLRYLQRQLHHLLDLAKRYEQKFAVLLMDIDGLKRINDVVVKEDRPEFRGMIFTVSHLVTVEEVD